MAKIASIMTNFFEDVEYIEPFKAFEEKGHQVVNIGQTAGEVVRGKNGASVTIERAVADVSPTDFDALLIPGGFSPDQLRADETCVRFTADFANSGKPVFAICHGPQLLINAGVVEGHNMTGYKSIQKDLENAGVKLHPEKSVVICENFVTSRNPDDIPDFNKAALDMLEQR